MVVAEMKGPLKTMFSMVCTLWSESWTQGSNKEKIEKEEGIPNQLQTQKPLMSPSYHGQSMWVGASSGAEGRLPKDQQEHIGMCN